MLPGWLGNPNFCFSIRNCEREKSKLRKPVIKPKSHSHPNPWKSEGRGVWEEQEQLLTCFLLAMACWIHSSSIRSCFLWNCSSERGRPCSSRGISAKKNQENHKNPHCGSCSDFPKIFLRFWLCPLPGSLLSHSEATLSLSHSWLLVKALPSFSRLLSAPDPEFGGFWGFGVVPLGREDEEGVFPQLPARSAPGEFGFSRVFLGMVSFSAASPGSEGLPGLGCPKGNRKKNTMGGEKI